jgi:hypothetical protein
LSEVSVRKLNVLNGFKTSNLVQRLTKSDETSRASKSYRTTSEGRVLRQSRMRVPDKVGIRRKFSDFVNKRISRLASSARVTLSEVRSTLASQARLERFAKTVGTNTKCFYKRARERAAR